MDSLSFMYQEVEANQTIVVEEVDELDLDRLRDFNDSYNSIMFNSERELVLKDGEYVFAIPEPKEIVP